MKTAIALTFLLGLNLSASSDVRSEWPMESDFIGVFADDQGTEWFEEIFPYLPLELHIIALLDDSWHEGILDAEFKLDNMSSNEGYPVGQITFHYTSDLVAGDLRTNFSIQWTEAQGAGLGIVHIGTMEFLMFDTDWIGYHHHMSVAPGDDCDCISTLRADGERIRAWGCAFIFNCDWDCYEYYYPYSSLCDEGPPVAVEESSWSLLKSLF